MTGTERIRWHDEPGGDIPRFTGRVGTIDADLFEIWPPGEFDPEWILTCALPGHEGRRIYNDNPEKLKGFAEEWLAEFVASLGAVFPEDAYDFGDDDGEPLEVKYAPGRRVRYVHPDYGYPGEQEPAAAILVLGAAYTIAQHSIGQSRTDLIFEGIPGEWFNSVLFEPVEEPEPVPPHPEDRSSWPTADELAEMSMHDQETWERRCADQEAAKAAGDKE